MKRASPITDEELVAYLDGALDAARRSDIDAALTRDAALSQRLAALDLDTGALRRAFDAVAAAAPVEHLRGRLAAAANRPRWQAGPALPAWLRIAAALVLGLGLGYAAALRVIGDPTADWHLAVADYQMLYTTATLASLANDPANQRNEVAAVATKIGLPINLETLQLPDLIFKRAQLLEFHGRPLAQFAYLDRAGGPIALCATRTGESDSMIHIATLRGLPAAYWSKSGFGFIVIGATQADTLQHAATLLAQQLPLS